MAKKKSTHQNNQPDPPSKTELQEPPSMADDNKEKISNLKSLNAVLLKETVEKRQEISALLESKKSLETALTRSESEVELLKSELTQLRDVDVGEEVVKVVVKAFMESQVVGSMRREKEEVEEMLEGLEREMEVVVKERDEIERSKFDGDLEIGSMKKMVKELRDEINEKVAEVRGLKEKVADVEERERSVGLKFREFKSKYEVLMNVVEEKEKEIGVMRKECGDLRGEMEGVNVEKGVVMREKVELCGEIEKKNGVIKEMEGVVVELKGLVLKGKVEEEKWRGKFVELERSYVVVVDEVEGLKADMRRLVNEKEEKEAEIARLEGEKSSVVVKLNEFEEELKKLKQVYGEIVGEKVRLEGVKLSQEREIYELRNELNEVQGNVALLQELNRDYVGKNEKLVSEIDDHENAIGRVSVERDELKKALDEEKKNGVELQAKVSDISKQMMDTAKVIKDLRALGDTLVAEKKEIEAKCCKLMEDKEMVEKEALLAKGKIEELEVSIRAKTEMFELALAMLRNTVSQLSMDNKGGENEGIKVKNERGINGEMEPIMAELEEMRSVFRSREAKVGEIHKEMESLQSSLMEAKKKSNLWTLISSATTIFAAVVSYAYASSSSSSSSSRVN